MCSGNCLRKRKLSIFMVIWKLLYIESMISLKFSWILQINLFLLFLVSTNVFGFSFSSSSRNTLVSENNIFPVKVREKCFKRPEVSSFIKSWTFSCPHQYQITASILHLAIFLMVMSDTWPLDHIMSNKKKTRV
jgi:hypothetical protein